MREKSAQGTYRLKTDWMLINLLNSDCRVSKANATKVTRNVRIRMKELFVFKHGAALQLRFLKRPPRLTMFI